VPLSEDKTRFITPGQEYLLENFTVTPINLREGRYWTVLTGIFSHQLPIHAFFNVIASHLMFTGLSPVFGTIPLAVTFLVGGVAGNLMTVAWMSKRGGKAFDERYPGQFYGALGMSAANLSVLGFAGAVYPSWVIKVYGMIPIKLSHVIIATWVFEALQYWRETGWDKIQSSVCSVIVIV
jgi:membrane associated rhomboid family serine protease